MISIYICDDEDLIRKEIEEEIKKQLLIHEYDMSIALSSADPYQLLETISSSNQRGIYFLDVDLKNKAMDGFHLGKEIRKYDPQGAIVYITAFKDLAYKTFQYHIGALDYITKDDPKQLKIAIGKCLSTIVERMTNELKGSQNEFFTLKIIDIVKHIPLTDIYYFETSSRSHRVILHAVNERIDFIANLSDIEKELDDRFVRTHRSFLVNENGIKEVDLKKSKIVMKNGETCLMSRKKKVTLLNRITGNQPSV